jgi:hypothetical protein
VSRRRPPCVHKRASARDLRSSADHPDSLKAVPLAAVGALQRLVEGRSRNASKSMAVCAASFMPEKRLQVQCSVSASYGCEKAEIMAQASGHSPALLTIDARAVETTKKKLSSRS